MLSIFSGEIASKPGNPLVDSYKSQTLFRDKLQDYKDIKDLNRAGSASPDKTKSTKTSSINSTKSVRSEDLGEEMTEF